MATYGDGSACSGGGNPNCALWGNPALPRCAAAAALKKEDDDEPESDPDSKAGQCEQSFKELRKLLVEIPKQNNAKYAADLAAWQSKSNSAQNSFNTNPSLWATYCKNQSNTCEYDKFFHKIQDNHMWGHTYSTALNLPRHQCLEACLVDPKCDMVTHLSNDTCHRQTVLKAGTAWGAQRNYKAALKTSDGWKEFNDARIEGNNVGLVGKWNHTWEQCKQYANSLGAGAVTWRTDKGCWPQFKTGNTPGHTINIKNRKAVGHKYLGDDHPHIKSVTKDPKPSRSELKYNPSLNIPSVVCQDCRSEMQNVSATDSQAAFRQMNQCIANIKEEEATAKAPSDGAKAPSDGAKVPSDGAPTPKDTAVASDVEEVTQQGQGPSMIVIGGAIGLCIIIVLLAVIIIKK
jgi:hypothetical protein